MFIKKIKKLAKNKYKITFDKEDELTLYEDVLIKYNLLAKKDLSGELIEKIKEDNFYFEIYEAALRYIDKKMRSKKEIYKYLNERYGNIENVNLVINKLKENGYIDDVKYCKSYVFDKLYLSKDGVDKIRECLINLDIDINVIDSEIDNIDNNFIREKLNNLIKKYILTNCGKTKTQLKIKAINHFIQLGFNKSMIEEEFDNMDIMDDENIILKEYEKLLKKYSSKYEGYKLNTFIRSKLYQRGFTIEEINSLKMD